MQCTCNETRIRNEAKDTESEFKKKKKKVGTEKTTMAYNGERGNWSYDRRVRSTVRTTIANSSP